jgi:hypothetical protein
MRIQIHLFTVGLVIAVLVLLGGPPSFAKDELTLRVNDAFSEPGGLAAIVVRTYSSRGLSSGQLEMEAGSVRVPTGASGAGPFSSLERVRVFAKRNDVSFNSNAGVVQDKQTVLLQFISDTAAVNRSDGPLVVYYFRVRDDVQAGQRFRIAIDAGNTMIFDRGGNRVPIRPRSGDLTIRSIAAPFKAEAEGDKLAPGEMAELGMETFEAVAMSSGSVGFRFDPAIAASRPRVKLSKKYGKRRYTVDRSEPGLVLVEFRSPNNSWNTVPGQLVSIKFRTPRTARVGSSSRVWLDPALTFFVDPEGDILPYRLEGNRVRFENGGSGGGSGGGDDDNDGDDSDGGNSGPGGGN